MALVVQVKSNQPTLHQTSVEIATTTEPLSSHHSHDKARGREKAAPSPSSISLANSI